VQGPPRVAWGKPGGRSHSVVGSVIRQTTSVLTWGLTMTPPADHAVRIHVHDASGRPVARAFVEAVAFDSPETAAHTMTAREGTATLRVPANARVYSILALKPGVGLDYFENYRAWPPGQLAALPAEIQLVLESAREVRVRVVDSADQPVPGIPLTPWTIKKPRKLAYVNCSGTQGTQVVSDANGLATFAWMPRDLEDVTQFLVQDRAYHCPDTAWLDPAHPDQPLTARLLSNGRLRGRVFFPDGRPAPGVTVQAEGRGWTNHYYRNQATSGPDGSYEFVVYPNQSYLVAVTDADWAARSLQGVVVREGEVRTDLDLHLLSGTLLRGRVSLGPEGQPASGQTVTLIERGRGLRGDLRGLAKQERSVRWAQADGDGRYGFRVGPGRYELRGPAPSLAEKLTLDGEAEVVRDFHLPWLARAVLAGEVRRWGQGRVVANARVCAESVVPGHAGFETYTDGQGRFSSERWRDRMVIYARDSEGVEAGYTEIGEEDDVVMVEVSPAVAACGRVVDCEGSPLCNEHVFCRMRVTRRDWTEVTLQFEARTDIAGAFTMPGLLVGSSCDVCVLRGHEPISPSVKFKAGDLGTIALPDITL